MGEYFSWINLDRKEYISPSDFEIGNKRYESVSINNALLCALRELMGSEWKGSKIIFIGDECGQFSINIPNILNDILQDDKFEGNFINEYGIDINNPFAGMFNRKGKSYKYTINYSKGVAYCLDTTKIITSEDNVIDSIDPLPVLLGYGNTMKPGEWLGDFVGVSDLLDTGITLLDKIRVPW